MIYHFVIPQGVHSVQPMIEVLVPFKAKAFLLSPSWGPASDTENNQNNPFDEYHWSKSISGYYSYANPVESNHGFQNFPVITTPENSNSNRLTISIIPWNAAEDTVKESIGNVFLSFTSTLGNSIIYPEKD